MTIGINEFLVVSGLLFTIGFVGLLVRRNTLILQSNVAGRAIDDNGENFISRHGGNWPIGVQPSSEPVGEEN